MYNIEAKRGHREHHDTLADEPPHWAVFAVKFCVIGLLLLPVMTFLWVLVYTPTEEVNHRPIAFLAGVVLGLGMFATAAFITTTYPPVRTDKKD